MDARAASGNGSIKIVVAALVGAALALTLGIYGKVHDPTGESLFTLFFTATLNMKAWFATVAMVLGLFQLYSALRMFRKLMPNRPIPSWLPTVHRLSGFLAVAFTIPVAYHCLWSLGFQDASARQVVHSLGGCFFYGTFFTKVVVVRSGGTPSWALPVVGGTLFTALVIVWFTSAGWFFSSFGFPSF
jgi:Family of unknown function (DUF6529)